MEAAANGQQPDANGGAVAAAAAAAAAAAVPAAVPEDPGVMMLFADEITRAFQIKRAAERQDGLKQVSDFAYMQYSICTPGESMEMKLERMIMMQAFKEEYNINDTPEEGIDLINRITLDHPGLFLSLEYLARDRCYATAVDWRAQYPTRIQTHEQYRVYMGGFYYLFQCKHCQFRAIRNGSTVIAECMDVSMENWDYNICDKMFHEFYRWYPKLLREMYLINANTVVNVAMGLWKRYLTRNQKEALKLGDQVSGLQGIRLDQLYSTPTPEHARQRLLATAADCLRRRYQHEAEFTLPVLAVD